MGYNKDELEKKSLSVIKRHRLTTIKEVAAHLPCSQKTFYNHELQELQSIKEAIEEVKMKEKARIKNKMRESDNPTLMIAYMKLLSEPDEWERLNSKNLNHSGGVDMGVTLITEVYDSDDQEENEAK